MKRLTSVTTLLAALAIILTFAACNKKNNPISQFQPEIANTTDNFQFQITNASHVTTTVDYDWRNTGQMATANQSCAITLGTAQLSLLDSTGTVLYTRNLNDNGTFQSSAGLAGLWKVRIVLNNLGGSLNFRLQKL
jgi:hypothetical protein